MNLAVHRRTPSLHVVEARGLTVRTVQYCRDLAQMPAQVRVNRSVYDAVGRVIAEWDPRLVGEPANLETVYSLSGASLGSSSVDAGVRVNLFGEAGQSLHAWDGRGSQRQTEYDELSRPVAVVEQALNSVPKCTQRYTYGAADQAFADHNQCGQWVRLDDSAGTRTLNEYAMNGGVLQQQQHFLLALDSPDWPWLTPARDALLEPGPGAETVFGFNALGDVLAQTDAQQNCQYFNQTVDGQVRDAWLHLKNAATPHVLVHNLRYNAQGQIEQQTAGNKVVSLLDYCPKDGRLTRLRAIQPGGEPLQDLNYLYDPVGNILSIEDQALPVRFFANQRVNPIKSYTYDSLYQLIEATGWEAGSDNRGPAHLEDLAAVANYRQTYRYDAGGNLLELIHHGPQQHGRVLTAAKYSNRCLPEQGGRPRTEAEIAAAFDHNGNLLALDNARTLDWDVRNQLQRVTPVRRASQLNDVERYFYGADGMRQRKVRSTHTNARTLISETRYLPGLETRNADGVVLHVITAQAGLTTVQVLHWETPSPRRLANDQYRYNVNDHLGSCSLELDSQARVISRETYHPFGSTAFNEKGDSNEESYRTLRYSGKERDATGLYYYGLRYYIPSSERWCNPDPAGYGDGLNLFAFVGGNPLTYRDVGGAGRIDVNNLTPDQKHAIGLDQQQGSPIFVLMSNNLLENEPGRRDDVVSDSIFASLAQASTANFVTKGSIINGSPNQVVDLWRAPMKPSQMLDAMAKERSRSGTDVTGIISSGVGNCGEHSILNFHLLASTQTQGPVFRVTAPVGEDHNFVVIGDPRILPPDELVIADAWPTFPMAHLANVGVFEVGSILESASAEADPRYQVDDAALISNSQVDFLVRESSGSKAKKHFKKIEKAPGTYEQLFSVEDEFLNLSYRNSAGQSFVNLAPSRFLKGRVDHYKSYDNARKKYG